MLAVVGGSDNNGGMTEMPDLPLESPALSAAAAPPSVSPRTDGSAVAALLCAIGSWFLVPVVLAIVALVLARKAELAIDVRPAELTGRGLVAGARWIAWTHLVVAAMVVAFVSAFAINRLALFVEHRVQVPGMIGGGK